MKAQSPAPTRSAAAAPVLLRETIGSIAVLTLNRPQARNSLSEAMLAELSLELETVARDERIRAVVLAANGPAFSAGHDLKELTAHRADADGGRGYTRQLMERCSAVMLSLLRLPQPVVAAVEATATAAGCQLVATCDLAVASATAKFATPGVHIGLFCSTPMVALSRNVPRKQAMEMLLTGEPVGAKSAAVVKLGKEAFYQQLGMNIADAYAYASEIMVKNMMARDAGEGISAFVEKRQPRWEDR